MRSSSRSRLRMFGLDSLGRLAIIGGVACLVAAAHDRWWLIGAVLLLVGGVWLTSLQYRAAKDLQADKALEAAAEYDRTHPADAADDLD